MITPLPPAAQPVPMSPGTYLRKRREAAGLSLELAAVAFVPWGRPVVFSNLWVISERDVLLPMIRMVANRIDELERDLWVTDRTFTSILARFIPLDVEIYDRLTALTAGIDVGVPQLCKTCGWSWAIPETYRVESGIPGCFAEHANHFSDTDPDLCAACTQRAADASPTPIMEVDNAS